MDVKVVLRPNQIYVDPLNATLEYVNLQGLYDSRDLEEGELIVVVLDDGKRRLAVIGREQELNWDKVGYWVS